MSIRKIRKQTLSLSSYLDKVREEDVRSDQEVQRLSGAWDAGMVNELVATVLTDDYIPPIILGEEQLTDAVQQWIIDGLQRSSSLLRFRYGNCRITSAIENSRIEYQKKKLDASGKICRDEDDNIIWESMQFDIRGKTFDELPAELKKNFDDYQIEMVIHQDCTMDMISKLVRRYNNHKPMNAAQRAFTYLDKYARKIRGITEHRFFKDCGEYTETEKKNGVYERIVAESVMAMFHLDHWQKNGKKMGMYLNENASEKEFDAFEKVLDGLSQVVGGRFSEIFTSKDSFLWFTLYHRFLALGVREDKFAEFLGAFRESLHDRSFAEYGNETFDSLDANKSTKDKKVIMQKLDMLEKLMLEFLHLHGDGPLSKAKEEETDADVSVLDFVREHVKPDATEEDIDMYYDMLDGYRVDKRSALLCWRNEPSMIGIVAYSVENDMDLDDWMVRYFAKNRTYKQNQAENYRDMKEDLQKYMEQNRAAKDKSVTCVL